MYLQSTFRVDSITNMVVENGSQMTPSSVEHLLHAAIFSIFIGYQMAIQMAINVVVFSIFNIVTPRCTSLRSTQVLCSKYMYGTGAHALGHQAFLPVP